VTHINLLKNYAEKFSFYQNELPQFLVPITFIYSDKTGVKKGELPS